MSGVGAASERPDAADVEFGRRSGSPDEVMEITPANLPASPDVSDEEGNLSSLPANRRNGSGDRYFLLGTGSDDHDLFEFVVGFEFYEKFRGAADIERLGFIADE